MKRKRPKIDREKYPKTSKSLSFRSGDQMVETTTETRSAVIDFNDILEATVVEPDECYSETPWENCDGYEHEFIRTENLEHRTEKMYAAGWVGWNYREGGSGLIVVDSDTVRKKWMGEYSPFSGQSRQVYEERIAEVRRQGIEQLVKWYENGWSWWCVVCDFFDETESLGGIVGDADSYDDEYVDEDRREMAFQMTHLLEKQGYTVVNQPPEISRKEWNKRFALARFARNLGFRERNDYEKWLAKSPPFPQDPIRTA